VLFTNVVPARNLPSSVESLDVDKGITFKALRRRGERAIVRRNERIFNGDGDDNKIELLEALKTQLERQRANHARHEATTSHRTDVADSQPANAAKETEANNNKDNKNNDVANDSDDDGAMVDNNDIDDAKNGDKASADDDGDSDRSEVTLVPTSSVSALDNNEKQPLT
jgi:hypothetical protein